MPNGLWGQSQIGHRWPVEGAGWKTGGNNYLHTFQVLISLGECITDVPSLYFPRAHQLYSSSTVGNLVQVKFTLLQTILPLQCFTCAAFATAGLKLWVSCVIDFKDSTVFGSDSFNGELHSDDFHGYLGNSRLCHGEFREGANWVCWCNSC